MSMQTELQGFERAVEARGRLLRVEADRTGTKPRQLVLTFDVGRILIQPSHQAGGRPGGRPGGQAGGHAGSQPGDDGLSALLIEDRADLPADLTPVVEEEPWWRVLGQPLTAAWPGGIDAAVGAQVSGPLMSLKMRFREEAENPRVVLLESAGSAVRVSLEG